MLKQLLAYGLWVSFWYNKVFTVTLKNGKETKKILFALKWQCHGIFDLRFFHGSSSHGPLIILLAPFQIFYSAVAVTTKSDCLHLKLNIWCALGCSVAELLVRWPAVCQAWVQIPARHPLGGFPLWAKQAMKKKKRELSEWIWMNVLYECDYECM